MAAVQLDRVWLLDPAAPSAARGLLFKGARQFDANRIGTVRRMANGRLRAVSRPGTARSVTVTVGTDAAGLAWLDSLAGRTVLYRDGLGTKMYAVFYNTPWVPSENGQHRDVTLTLAQVTFSEAV